jgi:hypothetical protein
MPKIAFPATIIVEVNEDSPAPTPATLTVLMLHQNFELVEVVHGADGTEIFTIRETAKHDV